MEYKGLSFPHGSKTWDNFKQLWYENRECVDIFLDAIRQDPSIGNLNFLVPIELIVPRDADDLSCVESFKNDLLDICAARNNNVQLQLSAKAHQLGYFETLQSLMEQHNLAISNRIEWKNNDGGDIKAQDLIALCWIPLSLINPVKDANGRTIEPVPPQNIYRGKGGCLKQFEKLMSSPNVTSASSADYKRELSNVEVISAFKIAVELPELYDYICEMFPRLYNAAGGSYGNIKAVRTLNEKRKILTTPFTDKPIDCLSPDGFIVPLVFGLQALMENAEVGNHNEIRWKQQPLLFLHNNLDKIVKRYIGIFSMCDYDPQKIGKNPQSYAQALDGYKMAVAGIL